MAQVLFISSTSKLHSSGAPLPVCERSSKSFRCSYHLPIAQRHDRHDRYADVPWHCSRSRRRRSRGDGSSSSQSIEAIILAGEGEPTMRLNDLISLVEAIRAKSITTQMESSMQGFIYTAPKQDFLFLELSRRLLQPPGAGRLDIEGFGWAWARMLRRSAVLALGPGPGLARPGPMHSLLNIRAQAHPNPSMSSPPAPGGRASGRLSSKKGKSFFGAV